MEDLEISLSRKGMYWIDEREMLRGIETAITQEFSSTEKSPTIGNAQIILGLEPAHLATAVAASDAADADWYNDSRFGGTRATVDHIRKSSTFSGGSGGDFVSLLKAAKTESPQAVVQAIALHIMKRCSSDVMTPEDSFDFDGKSIGPYGLDIMIGAELRNWLFKEFGLDLSFQTLLAPTLTFKALSEIVGVTVGALMAKEED